MQLVSARQNPGREPDSVPADVRATTLAKAPDSVRGHPYPQELPKTQTTSPQTALFIVFGEVVCVLGAKSFSQAARRGKLRHARVRHAGDTPPERFA